MNYFKELINSNYKGLVRIETSQGKQYRFIMEGANFEYSKKTNIIVFSNQDGERIALNCNYVVSITLQN